MALKHLVRIIVKRWYLLALILLVALVSQEMWVRFISPDQYLVVVRADIGRPELPGGGPVPGLDDSLDSTRDFSSWAIMTHAAEILTGDADVESDLLSLAENGNLLEEVRKETVRHYPGTGGVRQLAQRLRRLVEVGQTGEQKAEFRVRALSPGTALVYSWALTKAAVRYYEGRVRSLLDERRQKLEARREVLEGQWEEAMRVRLEKTREHGVTVVSDREDLLRKLLVEAEEEIHRLQSRQTEISHAIDERWARNSGAEESKLRALDGGGRVASLWDELQRARLEYQVQASSLTDRHPRVVQLGEKISELESRIAEARARSRQSRLEPAVDEDGLVEEYRLVSRRLDGLREKRSNLFSELTRLERIRPELQEVEDRLTHTFQKLGATQERIKELEWVAGRDLDLVHLEWSEANPQLVRAAVSAPLWRAGVAAGALILGAFLIWFLELLGARMQKDQEIHMILDLPLLAMVPRLRRRDCFNPKFNFNNSMVERFNAVATVLHSVARQLEMRVFAVSSAAGGEGKTLMAIQVAAALARKGKSVALVEGDLRRPAFSTYLDVDDEMGLCSILESETQEIQEVVEGLLPEYEVPDEGDRGRVLSLLQQTSQRNLYVLPAGPPCKSPITAIEGPAMDSVLGDLALAVDYVIVDTPPVLEAGESLAMAAMVDGCLLVVGSGQCATGDALWVKQLFSNVHASVLGIILNRCPKEVLENTSAWFAAEAPERSTVGV